MDIHLIDGTYELFRHFFAVPAARDADDNEIAAVRGVVASLIGMLENGATHVGVATDHVIESFRNRLYAGYKTGAGIEPALRSQFEPLERAVASLGMKVWPMIDQEADDAMAAAADRAERDTEVDRIFLCTPDKDLAQCVRNDRVVQFDRRRNIIWNEAGVCERFGISPVSIPDYLALVGDSADGFPGLRGWGARSAAAVLAHYTHLENIPLDAARWEVRVRGANRLATTLETQWEDAMLFRDLATLRTDHRVFDSVAELEWTGPDPDFADFCRSARADRLLESVQKLEATRRAQD